MFSEETREYILRIAGYYGMATVTFESNDYFWACLEEKDVIVSDWYIPQMERQLWELLREYRDFDLATIHPFCVLFMHEVGHVVLQCYGDEFLEKILDLACELDAESANLAHMKLPGELDATLWAFDQIHDSMEVFEELSQLVSNDFGLREPHLF